MDVPSGGRATTAGILYQMLRSLAVGCDVVAQHVREGPQGVEARLTIEPARGDLLRGGEKPVVEQIKMRRGKKVWSAGDIAEHVLPDLMSAMREGVPVGSGYRFTTDRDEGLTELRTFVEAVRNSPIDDPLQLDVSEKLFRYGRIPHTARAMYLRLAGRAGASDEVAHIYLWTVLRNLEILTIGESTMVEEIDKIIGVLADNQDSVSTLRGKLITDLMGVALSGGTISMSLLLERNGLDPKRLLHAARLPLLLEAQARKDTAALQYRPTEDVRASSLRLVSPVSVLGGESGQGKTWALCRAALFEASEGRPAVILLARGTVASLEAEIVKRVWLPSYAELIPLPTVAQRLRPRLADADGIWLTVFLDDLHDRDLARALILAGWLDLGIRLVISAQPTTQALLAEAGEVAIYAIPNFTLPELRRHLEGSGRNPARIPDDVLELLTRPILAATFTRLPDTNDWSDPSEYRLIDRYWAFATRQYRDQPLHLSDAEALKALVGTLFEPEPHYPFPTRLRMKHLDDDAARRLTAVGLVHESDEGLAFSHDRLLNWGVASIVADKACDGLLGAAVLSDILEQVDAIRTNRGDPLGNRLGYVLLDVVWLLARSAKPELLAQFLLLQARRAAKRDAEEHLLARNLATIGAALVPSIRIMLDDPFDGANEWLWPGYLARALRRIGQDTPDVVRAAIVPLLDSEHQQQRLAALNVLRGVPAPEAAPRLFQIHLEHAQALKSRDEDFADRYANHTASFAALVASVGARPEWLANRAEATDDPEELEQLIWLLLNIEQRVALPYWHRFKAKFFAKIVPGSTPLLRAIRDFVDWDEIDRLECAVESSDGMATAFQFDGLVRLDAARAVRRLEKIDLEELSGTSSWWIDGLMHRAGGPARLGLRPRGRVTLDPYGVVMGFYRPRMELLDVPTLDLFLDELERRLADPPTQPDPLQDVWRWLEFVRDVATPELIDSVHRRRGTRLEKLLSDRACNRAGRTSRYVDLFGDAARDVLAIMAGEGFDALAVAQMGRDDRYAQEDGLITALWTDSEVVGAELGEFSRPRDDEQYRKVMLHHALAAHRKDDVLSELLASGDYIYNDAVEIRRSRPPMADEDVAGYRDALRSGELKEAKQAVRMSAFAGSPDLFAEVVGALLRDDIGADLLKEAVGVFRYNGIYDPRLLPLIGGGLDANEEGAFAAGYLAMHGDAEARAVAAAWLNGLPDNELHQREFVVVQDLLEHPDSKQAALDFLHRRLRGRRRSHYAGLVIELAESGDAEAVEAVHSLAYQSPRFGDDHPIHAIRFLGKTAPDEAFAAAERLFARHRDASAAREMLLLDGERALSIILAAHRHASCNLRWWLARLLRWYAARPLYLEVLEAMAVSADQKERQEAAELAGWLPNTEQVPLLDRLTDDTVRDVELAAFAALRRRSMEKIAVALMGQLANAPRPLAWARMRAIIRLVDPHVLGRRDDPAWIGPALDELPAEFRIDAKRWLDRARKKVEDEAKKRDRKRDED